MFLTPNNPAKKIVQGVLIACHLQYPEPHLIILEIVPAMISVCREGPARHAIRLLIVLVLRLRVGVMPADNVLQPVPELCAKI